MHGVGSYIRGRRRRLEKGTVACGFLADGGMECGSDAGGAVAGRLCWRAGIRDSRHTGGAQKIPGRVECAYYDRGGEGVTYHDTDARNNGSGALNPADGLI